MRGRLNALQEQLAGASQQLAEAKARGQKVVGYFCPYVPEELILAAGMLPLRLAFGGPESCAHGYLRAPTPEAAPYYEALDALVVAAPGAQAPELQAYWREHSRLPVFVLDLPRAFDRARTAPAAETSYRQGLSLLRKKLEELGGRRITDGALHRAIALTTQIREGLRALYEHPWADAAPLAWREVLAATQAGYLLDRHDYLAALQQLAAEAAQRPEMPPDTRSRLMLAGSPLGMDDSKLLDAVAQAGGNVVADGLCTASLRVRRRVPRFGFREDPLDLLTAQHLYSVPCPYGADPPWRRHYLVRLARAAHVHGLIYYNLGHDQALQADYKFIKENLYRELVVPTLLIATHYGADDAQDIRAKAEAFIELLGGQVGQQV